MGKKRLTVASATMLGLACTFGVAGTLAAEEEANPSSACIRCHTDLGKMDEFGAAAASASAGIAG